MIQMSLIPRATGRCQAPLRVGPLPAGVDQHGADLADGDRDLEADLADRLGLARRPTVVPQLGEEALEPRDRLVILLLRGAHPLALRQREWRRRARRGAAAVGKWTSTASSSPSSSRTSKSTSWPAQRASGSHPGRNPVLETRSRSSCSVRMKPYPLSTLNQISVPWFGLPFTTVPASAPRRRATLPSRRPAWRPASANPPSPRSVRRPVSASSAVSRPYGPGRSARVPAWPSSVAAS